MVSCCAVVHFWELYREQNPCCDDSTCHQQRRADHFASVRSMSCFGRVPSLIATHAFCVADVHFLRPKIDDYAWDPPRSHARETGWPSTDENETSTHCHLELGHFSSVTSIDGDACREICRADGGRWSRLYRQVTEYVTVTYCFGGPAILVSRPSFRV